MKFSKMLGSQEMIDGELSSAQRALTKLMKVYKGAFRSDDPEYHLDLSRWKSDRWGSWTTKRKNAYGEYNVSVTLRPGTKVVFADGIADDDEVIVRGSEIIKNIGDKTA